MAKDLTRADETELIKKALKKDTDAFGELASRYEKSLFNVVYGVVGDVELARDVTQESFLRAYRWQYIVSGAQHPHFGRLLADMTTPAQMTRIQQALAPIVRATLPTRRNES